MPDKMRVIEITQAGGPEVLCPAERDIPVPAYDEVLIKVAFAGVNRPDALQRAGLYAPPAGASDLPGLEASGTIIAVGEGVHDWAIGDQVCALLPGGGYAEFVTTPAAHCLPVPNGMSLHQAALLPETFFTVWSNVFERGELSAGDHFLVHGGTSGIGTTAIQLASAFGARVYTTAGTDEKCNVCRDLGAEIAINYRDTDFVAEVKNAGGADVILDMVGGDYIARNLKCLNVEGRLVQIAFLQGSKVNLNLAPLMMKRQTLTGSTLRPQSVTRKAEIAQALLKQVWPLLSAGRIKPVLDEVFSLDDAHLAHAKMERSDHIGKIALKVAVA